MKQTEQAIKNLEDAIKRVTLEAAVGVLPEATAELKVEQYEKRLTSLKKINSSLQVMCPMN